MVRSVRWGWVTMGTEGEPLGAFFRTVQGGLQAGFQLAQAALTGMGETGDALIFVSSRSVTNETAY